MISSIQFQNFRVLEHAALPLGAFNLLLGPNGSGKTTAIRALLTAGDTARAVLANQAAPILPDLAGARVEFGFADRGAEACAALAFGDAGVAGLHATSSELLASLAGIRGYVLDPGALTQASVREAPARLAGNGAGLPAVLAALRRDDADRWERFLAEVRRILPEIVEVIAGETTNGHLAFSVVHTGGKTLRPENLSHGTLVILALLALTLAADRPSFVCLEELERGIHPRLLRDVRDILYRLSFPADCGDDASAVQVLTTTHSPYVLDLFVDTPEDVIIATRDEAGAANFRRMDAIPELREMLGSGNLGDLWYSGILGGVP